MRDLFNRPSLRRPKLGKPPAYLFDDAPELAGTRNDLRQLTDACARYGKGNRTAFFKRTFLDSLSDELGQFIITKQEFAASNTQDDIIMDRFTNMQPLRDHIVEYIETICVHEEVLDIDAIIHLMQTLHRFEFHVDDPHHSYEAQTFVAFSSIIRSIDDYRKRRLNSNRISLVGDIFLERTKLPRYSKRFIIQADAILFLLSPIYTPGYAWRPPTWPYATRQSLPLLQHMKSLRHAEKVKVLFKVDKVENLRKVVSNLEPPFQLGTFDTLHIRNSIHAEDIATLA